MWTRALISPVASILLVPTFVILVLTFVSCGPDPSGSHNSSSCVAFFQKLRGCSLLTQGPLNCREPATVEGRSFVDCEARCLNQLACPVLQDFFCSSDSEDMSETDSLRTCLDACEVIFTCADGEATFAWFEKCDGTDDCDDGSDEAGCPMFTCTSGEKVLARWKCDGYKDCDDGSDEAGCPARAELICPT